MEFRRVTTRACQIKAASRIYQTLQPQQIDQLAAHVRRSLQLTDRPRSRDYLSARQCCELAIFNRYTSPDLIPADLWPAIRTAEKEAPASVTSTDEGVQGLTSHREARNR